jgi:hypothetical protein
VPTLLGLMTVVRVRVGVRVGGWLLVIEGLAVAEPGNSVLV